MKIRNVYGLVVAYVFVVVALLMFAYLSDRDARNNSVRLEAVKMGHARFVVVPNTNKTKFEWLATNTAEIENKGVK